jgi:hypothetical protein
MTPGLILTLLSGICWTIVYIDSIRLGFKQKTYAIPLWALTLNIAWELLQSILGLKLIATSIQEIVNIVWFLLDVVILFTYFRFGARHFPKNLPANWFYPYGLLALAVSFILQFAFIQEFGLIKGASYSAFLQNLLMSLLFIAMLLERGSAEGQSLLIAIAKWLGTLAPTILFGLLGAANFPQPFWFILITGLFCSLFDLLYIFLLSRATAKTV